MRLPASKVQHGDYLVCSDGTRVRVAHFEQVEDRYLLRLAVSNTHQAHPTFSVPAHTHFVKED